ncbi:unnamed protein product, partial [Choristocarpus tenellus]
MPRVTMNNDSDDDCSLSWPGSDQEEDGIHKPLPVRRTFSHFTQVRHNGYLTKRFKRPGEKFSWSRQFCTLHGNILRCYTGKLQHEDNEDPVEVNVVRGMRAWNEEFGRPYDRGLLVDCDGGDTIIARTDTAAEQEEWCEALYTVTELLSGGSRASRGGGWGGGDRGILGGEGGGGASGDEDSDDGDVTDYSRNDRLEESYLAQKNRLLTESETSGPCTVVFLVSKTDLERVEEENYGRFNNGDVYLVMYAAWVMRAGEGEGAGLVRTLYYWVGSKAPIDKGMVASIKAVELRRALSGVCTIVREDEGQESPEFLLHFDGDLEVVDEESAPRPLSKVTMWNELPPIMYTVRERRAGGAAAGRAAFPPRRWLHSAFTVGRVDLDEDQLGSDRVLLVDDRNGHVFLWFGQCATFKQRGFGLEAAACLKADNPKGGQVLQVDEDDEPPDLRRILDSARKKRLMALRARAAEEGVDEEGSALQGAVQRRMSLMGAGAGGTG